MIISFFFYFQFSFSSLTTFYVSRETFSIFIFILIFYSPPLHLQISNLSHFISLPIHFPTYQSKIRSRGIYARYRPISDIILYILSVRLVVLSVKHNMSLNTPTLYNPQIHPLKLSYPFTLTLYHLHTYRALFCRL